MNPFKKKFRKLKALAKTAGPYREFQKLAAQQEDYPFVFGKRYAFWGEGDDPGGTATGQYFHQDLLVAQMIHNRNPVKHIDIGSSVATFGAHVASFREIEIFEYRPIDNIVRNMVFKQMDLMNFDPSLKEYSDSISCLHTIEHMGLGRFGDPLNPNGHLDAIDNVYKMLQPGGTFYFSAPMGHPQRIEFNAHRIFSTPYLKSVFADRYETRSFSYVDDAGDLHFDAPVDHPDAETSFGCDHGCGIFELVKK